MAATAVEEGEDMAVSSPIINLLLVNTTTRVVT
jgi:hypothetical protein